MPFSPSDISGLKIWLKADAGAGSSDGDPVGTWTDQSGTSHDFTQATAGKKPLYKTNIRRGLPVVRFDGSDDEMSGGDLSAVFPSAGSMFCAVSGSGTPATKLMVYKTKDNDSHWSFGGPGYWGVFRSTRLSNTPSSGLPATGWHMWSVTANGTAYKMWLDGTNQINSGSFTFDGGNNHNLGRQVGDGYFQGMDLGELIVYDSALSDADRANVENYLLGRWISLVVSVGQATESDTAQRLAHPFTRATETDTARQITVRGVVARALETDTANAFTPARAKGFAQAVETDTAQVFTAKETHPFAQATEADTAQPISPLNVRSVTQVMETDLARGIFPTGGSGGTHPGVPDPTALWTITLTPNDG